ncbi:MAG: membrane protein insertion efficiency factor YidD [Thermodesulfobacteriota bacterium]
MKRFLHSLILPCLLASLCLFPLPVLGEEGAKGEAGSESPGFNLGASLVSLFRDHLSAVDSDRCPSYPTCSSYSVEAFRKHGFVMGWLMTVDRLIHEGREETAVSPLIYSEGQWKIYDPVQNNDFWWHRPEKQGP